MSQVSPQTMANAIRALAMDAVQKAKSGHPGMPMGMADIATALWTRHLRFNPQDPKWSGRDRFILSNGHGSMLQYALLHLTGFDLSMDDLKAFRQLGSRTPEEEQALQAAVRAGKYERVREGLKACILMVVAFSLLITIILFLFGNQLLSLFLDPGDTSGALGYGLSYMHTVSVFYILMGLLFVPNGMLRGAGDMGAFTISSMANLFSRVAIAYALVYLTPLGANAIWWSIPAGWLIGATVSLLRVKSGKWMRKAVADR